MNLIELSNSAREADAAFEEILAPKTSLKIGESEIRVDGRSLKLTAASRTRVYEAFSAPSAYMTKLSTPTQDVVLDEIVKQGDPEEQLSIAVRGDEVFTIARGGFIRLRTHEVIDAVIESLGENANGLSLTRIGTQGDTLDLELASARKSIDVERGDTVQAGFHIFHSTFGEPATAITPFTYRLVCKNGMIHRSCPSQSGIGRTRKLSVNHPNGRELQVEQIRRLIRQAWEGLEPILSELQATRERKTDVEGLLTGWLQRARISTAVMMPRLREAWQQDGGENTQYGAINALTRVATHGENLSARQRRVLASLAGLLAFSNVHICPRCFTMLSQNTTGGADS